MTRELVWGCCTLSRSALVNVMLLGSDIACLSFLDSDWIKRPLYILFNHSDLSPDPIFKLAKEFLKSLAVLDFVPSFFVEGAPPPLIASLGVPTHGVGPFDVRLVLDPAIEFCAQISFLVSLGVECITEIHSRLGLLRRPSLLACGHNLAVKSAIHAYMSFMQLLIPNFLRGLANCLYKRSMVISRLSAPLGSNRPGFCPEVALAALCASSDSLSPLYPGVLGARGVSLRVLRLSPTSYCPDLNDSSELTMAPAGTAVVFSHDCSELQCGGPPSLLSSDSLVEISALARLVLDSPHRVSAQRTTELAK
ncbi:hypothetical protein Acr_29g0006280 [Actinidia rufa]|uniref:Uncharacterized protein n=1 Tax=Actinidia rufa TaxID=165716 RepID=A0A7J0HED9_9ERIC|nr:hypothetical protein Acr_29g0006280 [Actinidia rufa]